MTREHEPVVGAGAERLAALARASLGAMTEAQRNEGLRAVRVRLGARRRVESLRRSVLMPGGALAITGAIAAVYWLAWSHRHERASRLTVRVDGAELQAGGAVEAAGSSRPVLRFSDGSEIVLAEGSRVRVPAIDEHGAQVTLESGETHVSIVHAEGTRWAFDAGPFVVAVTGTAFGLSWQKDAQRFDVRLESGAVSVSGPFSDGPLSLRAGQWLTVQGGEIRVRGLRAAQDGDHGGARTEIPPAPRAEELHDDRVPPATSEPPTTRDAGRSAPRRAVSAHGRRWAVELTAGHFEAIVADATALGIDAVLAESDGDDLGALADAARYTRRPDVARAALLAERRRFAGTEHALGAAFYLGRMAEAEQNPRGALPWFDTYLAEAPAGRYASEALGRKMNLVEALDGKAAAKPLADAYVRRFPDGTYAAAARALIAAP